MQGARDSLVGFLRGGRGVLLNGLRDVVDSVGDGVLDRVDSRGRGGGGPEERRERWVSFATRSSRRSTCPIEGVGSLATHIVA
jgi:hypothetical protein